MASQKKPTTGTGGARPLPRVSFDEVMRPAPQPARPGKEPQPPQNTPPAA